MQKSISIIVKPNYACNAACLHCSISNDIADILRPLGVSESIKNVVAFAEMISGESIGTINIIMHGGEPMLHRASYINEMAYLLEKTLPTIEIKYSIQTNLLAYNQSWKSILKNVFAWNVSSSYDFYSSFRQTKDGSDYFSVWYDKVKQYQDDSGRRLYTICVLSRENINYIKEIIDDAYSYGLDIKLNYMYPAGKAVNMDSSIYITPEEYGDAIIKAYNAWVKYSSKSFLYVQGKIFEDSVKNGRTVGCPFSSKCLGKVFSIMPNGDLYNCAMCADMSLQCFGNVVTNDINYSNIASMKIAEIVPEECIVCGICNGGCKKDRLFTNTEKTPFCESYKKFHRIVTKNLYGITEATTC